MKIERLYAITIYLLNHGRSSASKLAKYFEVSTRTIQRDIDSLCIAGIPIIAVNGSAGGYEVSDQFKIDAAFATSDEYSLILTALRGYISATDSPKAKHMFEKLSLIAPAPSSLNNNCIILDFSVLREGEQTIFQKLQTAITKKCTVHFTYTNNNNETRTHLVEPIAVIYQWYAWYLLAYSKRKQDYRTYKLVRMENLILTEEPFTREHKRADTILQEREQKDQREYTDIILRCKQKAKSRAVEYLKASTIQEFPNGDLLMKATVVDNEQFWFGALLSMGDNIEVIEPEKIRRCVLSAAEKIISLYNYDKSLSYIP